MKLFYFPGACSMAPHIVAREAGLAVEIEKVDLKEGKTERGDDFAAINPKRYVPALQLDDGQVLTEVANLVQYLADQAPASKLAPAPGSMERYRLNEWLIFVSSEIHKGFSPLFKPDTPEAMKPIAKANLQKRFAYLDQALAGRQYLMGDQFTAADAYLFTVTNWHNFHNLDISQHENLTAYQQRIATRPAVRDAMAAEGLLQAAA